MKEREGNTIIPSSLQSEAAAPRPTRRRPSRCTCPGGTYGHGVRALAAYLLGIFVICATTGVLLFFDPGMVATVWPYAVRPLAARMFASMFLALAVAIAAGFVFGLRSSAKGVLVTHVPILAMVLPAALLNSGAVLSSGARGVGWVALFAGVAATGAIFLLGGKEEKEQEGATNRTIPRGLRRALIVHTVVVVFFGVNMLILLVLALNLWPWKVSAIVMQGLGGFFLGSAVGTGWAAAQRRIAH